MVNVNVVGSNDAVALTFEPVLADDGDPPGIVLAGTRTARAVCEPSFISLLLAFLALIIFNCTAKSFGKSRSKLVKDLVIVEAAEFDL